MRVPEQTRGYCPACGAAIDLQPYSLKVVPIDVGRMDGTGLFVRRETELVLKGICASCGIKITVEASGWDTETKFKEADQ